MLTDIEIANSIKLRPITDVAHELSIEKDEIELYGNYKAKINNSVYNRLMDKNDG